MLRRSSLLSVVQNRLARSRSGNAISTSHRIGFLVRVHRQQQQRFSTSQEEQMREANRKMAPYHDARNAMKLGKLKPKNPNHRGPDHSSARIQLAIAGVFVIGFLCMPMLGKKIAQDDEFREKYIPSWYDYTVRKPDNAWTRDELHEQMVQVQHEIRERAIRGDFAPDKLDAMQASLNQINVGGGNQTRDPNIPKGWDSIHPGAGSDGENSLNED